MAKHSKQEEEATTTGATAQGEPSSSTQEQQQGNQLGDDHDDDENMEDAEEEQKQQEQAGKDAWKHKVKWRDDNERVNWFAKGKSLHITPAVLEEEGEAEDVDLSTMQIDPVGGDASSKTSKGKGKALDPNRPVLMAPSQKLPNRNIFSIEYPGFLPPPAADGEASEHGQVSALDRALATLSPHPPPLGTPQSALKHIAWVLEQREEALECRLGAQYFPLKSAKQKAGIASTRSDEADSSTGRLDKGALALDARGQDEDEEMLEEDRILSQAASLDPHLPSAGPSSGANGRSATTDDAVRARSGHAQELPPTGPLRMDPDFAIGSSLYKHPLVGNVVQTNNPVIRIRRRKWRRKGAAAAADQPASSPGSAPEAKWEHKEYMIELVGASKQTVRYRFMGDYAYEPDVGRVHLSSEEVIRANMPPGLGLRKEHWKERGPDGKDGTEDQQQQQEQEKQQEAQRQVDPDIMDVDEVALLSGKDPSQLKELSREEYGKRLEKLTSSRHGTVLLEPAERSTASKTLALHAALMTMNTKALRAFRFDPELQKNTLNLIPPAQFIKPNVAFPYYYRQHGGAVITETTNEKGQVVSRWSSGRTIKMYAATSWRFGVPVARRRVVERAVDPALDEDGDGGGDKAADGEDDDEDETGAAGGSEALPWTRKRMDKHQELEVSSAPVPLAPPDKVLKDKSRLDKDVVSRLIDLFNRRPVWTRVALANEFPNLREKQLILYNRGIVPQVAYTIIDGPWKDCLVRFGYDVREEFGSRLYQRVSFRLGARGDARKKSRGTFSSLGPSARGSSRTPPQNPQARDGEEEEGAEAEEGETGPIEDNPSGSHIFDGKRIIGTSPTFCLIDITDPFLKRLILDQREHAVRSQVDVQSGWYTTYQWELIKEVAGLKYKKLAGGDGVATWPEVENAIDAVRTRCLRLGVEVPDIRYEEPGRAAVEQESSDAQAQNGTSGDSGSASSRKGKGKARAK